MRGNQGLLHQAVDKGYDRDLLGNVQTFNVLQVELRGTLGEHLVHPNVNVSDFTLDTNFVIGHNTVGGLSFFDLLGKSEVSESCVVNSEEISLNLSTEVGFG